MAILAVIGVGSGDGAAAAVAPVTGTVASSSVVAGSSVKATLTAVPATSGTAKLQYKSGSTWKTDARSIVVTNGKGSTTLKPPSDRSYRFVYGGVTSAAFTVKVTAGSVKGTVASSSVVAGSSVKATLTAVPATSGTAKLQYKSGSTWKTDARSIVVTNGKGSTTLKPPSDRSYRFVYGGVTSAAFTVKVTAGSVKGTVASSSVVAGSSVKATLTAVPATSGTAKLQYKSGSTWKTDARSIVVTKGRGSTTLKPPSDRSYRFVYGGVTSAAFTVKVTAGSVKGTVASSSVVAGSSVKATLTAVPATSGTAKLQYKSGSTWKTDARSIVVTKGSGSTTLKPPSDRSYRFVYGGVTSAAFTVKVTPAPVTPAPATPASVTGTVASASVVAGSSVKATLTAVPATSGTATLQYLSGGTWKTDARSIVVTNGNGSTTLKPPSDRSYRFVYAGVTSAAFTVKVTASPTVGSFIVKGSGWGHGVGMSQYGAYGMALDGYDATGILTHYFTGTSVSSVDTSGGKDFRVQIFGSGSDIATSVDLVVRSPGASGSTAGEWRMRFYASDHSTLLQEWTGAKDEDLVIGRNGTNITATRANGTSFQAPWVSIHWEGTSYYQPTSTENAYVELLNKKGGTAQTHGQYRHGRMFLAVISSRINIVNSLNLNTEYLYGVAEMPSSWSSAALQAQAIAARGYAMRALASGKSAACGCNVYDDARSQNFSGWKKESEGTNAVYGARWVAAVDATNSADGLQGQVLKDPKDTIATTYYFSSSGGQTENSEQVWSSTISYLRAASDPWSLDSRVKNPNASWTATVTQDKARAAFGLSDVATIAVTKRTSSASTAAAYVLTATSSTGQTSSITGADNIRIKLGLKSPWIWSVAAG